MKDTSPFTLYPSPLSAILCSLDRILNPESCLYAKLTPGGGGGSRGNAMRIILYTGKGGVGKTSICQVSGARCQVRGATKSPLSFAGVPAAIGMWVHDKWPLATSH